MTCKDVNGLLDRLMDGELTEDERRELEAHGQTCPDCAEQIRATLAMKALFEDMPAEADVPLAAQAKWRGAIREEARKGRQRRMTRWIGSAAAAVVVLLGVGMALNGSLAPKQDAVTKLAVVEEAAEADGASEAAYEAEAESAGEVAYEAETANEAEAPVVETDGARSLMSDSAAAVGGLALKNSAVVEEAAPEAADEAAVAAPEAMEAETFDDAEEAAPMCAALAQQSPACEYVIQARSVDIACEVIAELASEFDGSADVQDVEGGSANVYVELDAAYAGEFLAAVAKLDDAPTPADVPQVSGEGAVLVLLVVEPAEGE